MLPFLAPLFFTLSVQLSILRCHLLWFIKKITLILSGTQIEQNSLEGMSFCVIISDNTTLIIKLKQIVYLSVYVSESLPH